MTPLDLPALRAAHVKAGVGVIAVDISRAGTDIINELCVAYGTDMKCRTVPRVVSPNRLTSAQKTAALHLIVAAVNALPALLDRLEAAEKDAARYRLARTLSFGVADWGNPHAKPVIATLGRADAILDNTTTPEPSHGR